MSLLHFKENRIIGNFSIFTERDHYHNSVFSYLQNADYCKFIYARYHFDYLFNYIHFAPRIPLRGVPTEGRKPFDYRYRCIERVCRSVGTLILCDCCYFRSKKTTKITWDGLRPSSNMLNISLAMGMFSY